MNITIKLIDMRFFDREQEFKKLREIEQNIKKKFKSLHGYNFNYELNNQL